MKKLLQIILLATTILQSCKVDDAEVTPNKLTNPVGVDIQRAVNDMQNFNFSDFKAILLKPVDYNINTNLTTLYYADSKGKIAPIIENFEVQDVRVTKNGIYVLTNYDGVAFFVKPNFEWIQVKNRSNESPYDYLIEGEDDNGNLVFHNGAILNTTTLQVDRSRVKSDRYFDFTSGNTSLMIQYFGGRNPGFINAKMVNHVTNTEHIIYDFFTPLVFYKIVSFKGTDFVMYPDIISRHPETPRQTMLLDMKTGKTTMQDAPVFLLTEVLRLDDGSIVGLYPDISSTTPKFNLVQLAVKKDVNSNAIINRVLKSSASISLGLNISDRKGYLFGSDKYYIFAEADKVRVFDKSLMHKGDVLNGLSNATLALVDGLVYYSGTKDGQPVSGVYNLDTNQNTVLDNTQIFTAIQPLP